MNILQAMRDPKLFGGIFKESLDGKDTWAAWRAFLAALFGLPLEGEALELCQKHTGRADVPGVPFREAFVVCGRRAGKSILAAFVAVYLACFRDYSEILAPGEGGVVMLLASDRRQARVLLGYVNGFFDKIPLLAGMVAARRSEAILLTNGLRLEIHTSDFRAVRGFTIIAAVADEISFWPTDNAASPDTEILAALRPGMASVPGALLLAISSPYARRGALWEAWREYFGKADAPCLVWQGATREMNPTISPAIIERAYASDPASAAAEYGAQFRTDVENFIPLEVVEARVVPGRFELPPAPGATYSAFVDPSGGSHDSFTLGIAHAERETAVLDLLREVKPPFSPENVVAEFCVDLKRYRVGTVVGDRYGGEWPREQFRKQGIEYKPSEKTKSELYLDLLPALNSAQVELLDNARLLAQLRSLERRTSRAGRDSVDHPPGAHDDLANSAGGALVLALQRGWGVLHVPMLLPSPGYWCSLRN